MKTIIAGSRKITNCQIVYDAISESGFKITEVVSGEAIGVDLIGSAWGRSKGIAVKPFLPNYKKYTTSYAPLARNADMAEYADALIAVWDGKSTGTKDMIKQAEKRGLNVYVKFV